MNIEKIREDFPITKKYAYLDSACMSLKPVQVIEAMNRYFLEFPACGERSSHALGRKVTEEFESARKKVAKFIGAKEEEIIFTKNTTEGLNLAANALGLKEQDIVITSDKEHNSNFLPWRRFNHKIVETINGIFDLSSFENMMDKNVRAVALQACSNIDGMEFPVREIGQICKDYDSFFIVDGAQSVPHQETDVKRIGCDIIAFSGHKMLGPSIGVLYVKKDLAEKMSPFILGGGTVANVIDGKPIFMKSPQIFEAGLQNYAGAIGLAAAVDYIERIGMKNVEKHEKELNNKLTEQIEKINGVEILGGTAEERHGIMSFNIKNMDPKEVAIMLDTYSVLVRAGFHCCHNWFNSHKINGSARASLYFYNNDNDIQRFIESLKAIAKLA